MGITIKDSIQKFFGYILLIGGIFFLVVGIGMLFDPDLKDRNVAPSIIIFSNAFTIPGLILIILGRRNNKIEEQIELASGIVKSYRRITIADLAEKLKTSNIKAEEILSKALTLKLINGNFDRTTGEFFTVEAENQEMEYKFCPSCGAPLERIYLKGDTIKCNSCGTIT